MSILRQQYGEIVKEISNLENIDAKLEDTKEKLKEWNQKESEMAMRIN